MAAYGHVVETVLLVAWRSLSQTPRCRLAHVPQRAKELDEAHRSVRTRARQGSENNILSVYFV